MTVSMKTSSVAPGSELKLLTSHFLVDYSCMITVTCLANIQGSVGLILAKASTMRISIPLDLSSRSFVPLPRLIHSRRHATLLNKESYRSMGTTGDPENRSVSGTYR
jgi:hypothetical protein